MISRNGWDKYRECYFKIHQIIKSRYLSQRSRRNCYLLFLLQGKEMSHFCNTVYHAQVISFTTRCDQTCDRTKATQMIFASSAIKTVLEYLHVFLNSLIFHRSLGIICNPFCLRNIDFGLAKLSITLQLQAVESVDCYHPFFGHHNYAAGLPQQRKIK